MALQEDPFFGFNTAQRKTLENLLGLNSDGDTAVEARVATLETKMANVGTWGATLAGKLNNDAGVTDTNYDITPLA